MSNLEIRPDDLFITSFPKSGNTWVRFFVANLMSQSIPVDFENLDEFVPDIYKADADMVSRLPRPRSLKSHQPYTPGYQRVIYIVRDVRAVVSSHYRQRLRMGKIPASLATFEFTKAFIRGETSRFGGWDSHTKGWIEGKAWDRSNFLLLRYEDLLTGDLSEFGKIADFLGFAGAKNRVEDALQRSSFERMKRLEADAGRKWIEKDGATDLSIPFMHSGRAESWKSDLDERSQQLLSRHFRPSLIDLGYDPEAP